MAQRCQLPPTEPGVFKGDHTTFRIWLNAFETYIETRCSSSSERLHYLGYYTAGEARNAITGFLQMGTADAYQQAKKRLTDRSMTVYALLDPQSDTCFVKESVLQELDLRGEDVTLELRQRAAAMVGIHARAPIVGTQARARP
ncbi:hypothetical protein FJT64_006988 [Amphibalanus amphitrite]|uniref:Uncharacterized protein n=1 Tax=Amphibalanus amphitrite TaxID=1232801 RepID=A0A6A4VVK9_AMPAM|nr:hypothetical protein FJT64_006988 [Amphibalanus amphitrite]